MAIKKATRQSPFKGITRQQYAAWKRQRRDAIAAGQKPPLPPTATPREHKCPHCDEVIDVRSLVQGARAVTP